MEGLPVTVSPQKEFDDKYISSAQICKELDVTRAAVANARRRGILPNPIAIGDGQVQLWVREHVASALSAWKETINARRGVPNG